MRRLVVNMAARFVTLVDCDDQCGRCSWRFSCFTSNETLQVTLNAEDLSRYGVIAKLKAEGKRAMRCPHCEEIFIISQLQITHNTKFKCWDCGRFNYGSGGADKFGILWASKEIIGW